MDDILEQSHNKLTNYLEKWISNKIATVLKSLMDLKNLKKKFVDKALAYQLYESNGVLIREQVSEYLKNLGQNEEKFQEILV